MILRIAVYATALVAAGSVLARVLLDNLDHTAKGQLCDQAALAALVGMVVSAALIPLRVWFLTGDSIVGAAEPTLIGMVTDSPLGDSVLWRGAGLALIFLLGIVDTTFTRILATVGAGLVAFSFAMIGHTMTEPRWLLAPLVVLHTTMVAFWIGGFRPLHSMALGAPHLAGALAHEFGQKALGAVGVLIVSGGLLLVLLAGSPARILETLYGQLFAIKLAVFSLLMGLAALNKLFLTPALLAGRRSAAGRLRRSIRAEVRLVALIFVITALATTITSPA
ncbi:MAG: CopD family protein [Pseudomonadota bacterium]